MGIVAIIPAANLPAANAALAAFGPGPHFTISGIASTGLTHGALHDWGGNAAYVAAIKARPGVVWNDGIGDISTRLKALLSGVSAQLAVDAPPLPSTGPTVAGRVYSYIRTPGTPPEFWLSISAFNRTTFPLAPETYPSLLRAWRAPGDVKAWKQPTDGFDAYRVMNPITLQPDRATHLGRTWRVSQGDGAGNNVWEPGAFGWIDEGPAA